MDFELSDDQLTLRDEFRKVLASACDSDTRRAAADHPGAVDPAIWATLAETGVFSVTLPEADGGLGAGQAEAVVVHEEIGRAAVPGPVIATAALAGIVPGAADGSTVVTLVERWRSPLIVAHLDGAGQVALLDRSGITLVEPSELAATALDSPLDPLSPVYFVDGPLPAGTEIAGAAEAAATIRRATLWTAATQVGLGAAAVDMGADYAKKRVQFGKVIGAFQAVKHLLADAWVEVETARTAVHAAAVQLDEGAEGDEAETAVAAARFLASRAAKRATRACVQVHGGMGFTWELDAHLFLKRALLLDTQYATPVESLEAIAGSL